MNYRCTLLLCLLPSLYFNFTQAQIIWHENFYGLADSTYEDLGTSAWKKYDAGITLVDGGVEDFFIVKNERFEGKDLDGEGVWSSEVINISGYPAGVDLRADLWQPGNDQEAGDYIRIYYVLDGSSETLFTDGDQTGNINPGIVNAYANNLVGDSVRIVVRMNNDGDSEQLSFDNLFVLESGTNSLYSIASGTWENGSTWSRTSGGTSCNCTPGPLTNVYIENGHTIDLNSESYFKSIDIKDNSNIRWISDSDLVGYNGGNISIESGSNINKNSYNASLTLQTGGYTITSNDAVTGLNVSNLIIRGNQDINIEGSGIINLSNDFNDEGGDHIITNNLVGAFTVLNDFLLNTNSNSNYQYGPVAFIHSATAGTLTVQNEISINKSLSTFTNNGTITTPKYIRFESSDIVYTNNGTTLADGIKLQSSSCTNNTFINSSGNVVTFNRNIVGGNASNFTVHNYGTFTIASFRQIDPSALFVNHANSTWTINRFGNDLDTRIDASASNNLVIYDSNFPQKLLVPVGGYYQNLTINGGSTRTSQGNIEVHDLLTITDGDIDLNTYNLTLGQNTSSTGTLSHSNGKIYNGTFRRYIAAGIIPSGTTAGFFPMGEMGGGFRPIYISAPASGPTSGGLLSISHSDNGTVTGSNFLDNGDIIVRTDDASWSITISGGITGGTYNINAGGTQFGTITDIDDLRLTLFNSAIGLHGTATGTTSYPMITRTGLSLSDLSNTFHLSSIDLASPLPVELTSFNAIYNNGVVDLNWSTSTEINNDYFEIERSANGQNFESIIKIEGAGNSSSIIDYFERDIKPLNGISFYRLKQTDYNGNYTYSEVIPINISNNKPDFNIFTNPTSADNIKVSFNNFKGSEVLLVIRDMNGREYYSKMKVIESDHQLTAIQSNRPIPNGTYLIIASSDDQLFSRKLIVKN